ncbi:hypothetical protein KFE25_013492 [Diacronema lutheri]|uniref:Chloride channel protein n=1 Tax=Diacronema lutheri TaxID=2081491 RepID=A0A8J5XYA6_DIALT|nr:hypothetical protein KFE25_013492 [Diacronema lutheri]
MQDAMTPNGTEGENSAGEPLNRRSRTLFESRLPWRTPVGAPANAAISPARTPPPMNTGGLGLGIANGKITRSHSTHSLGSSTHHLGIEQKNARYGSLTDAERDASRERLARPGTERSRLAPPTAPMDTAAEDVESAMSLAAVESIQPAVQRPSGGARRDSVQMMAGGVGVPTTPTALLLNTVRKRARGARARACSANEGAADLLVVLFMTVLGLTSALLTFAMDVAVDKLYIMRLRHFHFFRLSAVPTLSSFVWIAHGIFWGVVAIWVTARISPLAAGSGIPELKSILSGNVLYKYLSKRTLVAKVLGLTAALATGLPLGKEGPFIHASCCLCEALLSTPLFRELKMSHATRTQMLMAACSVGVGANFGAPVGGVLLAIELTSTYFLVSIYWKCFYTAVTGAVLSRMLYMAYKTKTHVLSATFSSFFDAEDVETDVAQLPAFITIGVLSGLIGALFVRANARWGAFRARRANTAFFRSKYYLALVLLVLWGVLSMPNGPLGGYMRKSQMGSLAELFSERTMRVEWGANDSARMLHLLIFFALRLSFTCVAITLPMPCGVFAPSLCAGAGLGRIIGEAMKYALPEHDTSPGGYAVLGAAAMAAGVTHTLSSAVLMFELTGGIKHALPMLVVVIVAFMVSRVFSVSIFDSILAMKKLPFLAEFRHKSSYHRPARHVLAHLVERLEDLDKMGRVVHVLRGDQSAAFSRWRGKAERAKGAGARVHKQLVLPSAVAPIVSANAPLRRACAMHCVYRTMTIADLEHLLSACTSPFLPWVEERTQLLLGAIRRAAIKQLVDARKRKYQLNERVVLSQRFAAHRACNSLHNSLTSASAAAARAPKGAKAPGAAAAARGARDAGVASSPPPAQRPPPASASSPQGATGGRIERTARSARASMKRLRTVDVRTFLRSSPKRTMMDDAAVELEPARSTLSDSIINAADSQTDLSIALEDVQSMFGGGQSAPPPVISTVDGAADAVLADGAKASDSTVELAPAPPSESAEHELPARRELGESAALRSSLTTLSESSVQVELDRSQWRAIDTPDGLQLTCTLAEYLDVPLSEEDWLGLQVEEAPFCIAASASMGQVHFYFSMLSLSCAFVTDHGKFVGMITKADISEIGL